MPEKPTFNLWLEPWVTVELPSTALSTLSLPDVLRQAHEIHALYEPSPLVVAAIHRLLVAILQDMYRPQRPPDLVAVWQNGRFHPEKIAEFANQYASHFDLFSEDAPFLQTADLGLQPAKTDNAKPVGYLLQEQTAGTAVTHYNHAYDNSQTFCAHCAAKGLLLMPAFASSGGAGIKPSINGVPPIYVLPGGKTLFDSLTASLTTPAYQPNDEEDEDIAWWQRPLPTFVGKKAEVVEIGYIYSLLFPARRVRLHPQRLAKPCSRCGTQTTWGVSTMVYEMGESRHPDLTFWWRDPFAAYRQPKKETDPPLPIRPITNRVLWREYPELFLPERENFRPSIINQLEVVNRRDETAVPPEVFHFRTIGLRTDMKMKIFEWEEAGFAVPPRLLSDADTAHNIKLGIDFAVRSEGTLKNVFNQYFGGGGKSERYAALKQQMSRHYWQTLGEAFQTHILQYTTDADADTLLHQWLDTVLQTGQQVFQETVLSLPATGDLPVPSKVKRYSSLARTNIKMIRLREDAMDDCARFLYGYRKRQHPKPQKQEVS